MEGGELRSCVDCRPIARPPSARHTSASAILCSLDDSGVVSCFRQVEMVASGARGIPVVDSRRRRPRQATLAGGSRRQSSQRTRKASRDKTARISCAAARMSSVLRMTCQMLVGVFLQENVTFPGEPAPLTDPLDDRHQPAGLGMHGSCLGQNRVVKFKHRRSARAC
jgi:hypothetical protein